MELKVGEDDNPLSSPNKNPPSSFCLNLDYEGQCYWSSVDPADSVE